MIRCLLTIAFSAAVIAGCVWSFRRAAVAREVRPRVDWAALPLLDRARAARDVAQSYGQSALAVVVGGWFVLVALASLLSLAAGRS